jgi:hypothetical protein
LFYVEYQNTGFGASTARRVKRPGFEGFPVEKQKKEEGCNS